MVLEKQGGTHYKVTTFSKKPLDAHSIQYPHVATRGLHLTSTLVHQSFVSPAVQNLIGPASPQPISVAPPAPAKNRTSPVVGTTELRWVSKLFFFFLYYFCIFCEFRKHEMKLIICQMICCIGAVLRPQGLLPS